MIKGDSIEYDLLAKWADFDCNGYYSCEIGVRDGMGSKTIMDNIKNTHLIQDLYLTIIIIIKWIK
jgi:hypothetical protein